MDRLLSVSMLSSNFGKLDDNVDMVNKSEADWFHLDIMDGVFVPNISYGLPIIRTIAAKALKPLDVHLMIVDPDRYLEVFKEAGAQLLSVHYEACIHLHRTLHRIRALDMKAGVALNPHTSVELLSDIIQDVDFVLLMSVNPGFGGQVFIEHTYNKITRLKEMIVKSDSPALIEIDGGVNQRNAECLYAAGADILVAGNAVFSAADPQQSIKELKV
ncbi:MAG: ribulose-phosphate 3-epimerase [Prevotellaceae bacterium]|jgi:ribulose-phosphate 3-epimerase|nr:ribulose-phosphate 3-epimerase [Prevotellaceae bacterium]